jgi:Ca2+-binding EF-hand superfamily protein
MAMLSRITVLGLGLLCCAAVAVAAGQGKPPAGKGAQPGDKNAPQFDAARFIKDHDKNNDGKLSKDELPGAAQGDLKTIDANNDGFVTSDELQKHADNMAGRRPQLVEVFFYAIDIPEEAVGTQELQAAYDQLRKLDKNNDGKIDEGEVKTFREQRKKEQIDNIFTALDRNKDGKLMKDEARGLWADDFGQLDKNNDGALDRGEVEAACALNTRKPGGGGNDKPGK